MDLLIDVEVVSKPVYETKVKRFTFETDANTTRAQMAYDPERKRAYSAAKEFIRDLYSDNTVKTKGVRRAARRWPGLEGPMRLRRYGQDEWDGKSYAYKVRYEQLK